MGRRRRPDASGKGRELIEIGLLQALTTTRRENGAGLETWPSHGPGAGTEATPDLSEEASPCERSAQASAGGGGPGSAILRLVPQTRTGRRTRARAPATESLSERELQVLRLRTVADGRRRTGASFLDNTVRPTQAHLHQAQVTNRGRP